MIRVAGEIRQSHVLALVMLLSIGLNLWGNSWGTPDKWHPDEVVDEATALVKNKSTLPLLPVCTDCAAAQQSREIPSRTHSVERRTVYMPVKRVIKAKETRSPN